MDILFKCPHCGADLEVEGEAAGERIDCPTCSKPLTIPAAPAVGVSTGRPVNAQSGVEKKMSVPFSDKPGETLIQKSAKSLAVAAREGRAGLRVRTIRHSDCKEVGKDLFDSKVSDILNELGETNIVSITPINYSYLEISTQKLVNDFGVMIVYHG